MGIFNRKTPAAKTAVSVPQSGRGGSVLQSLTHYAPLATPQTRLYYTLREAVPLIDAALYKLVRLTGGFSVKSRDPVAQALLDEFIRSVPVGGNQAGLDAFVSSFLEQLLTCGTAVGEMVPDSAGGIAALYNAPLENIELARAENGLDIDVLVRDGVQTKQAARPELLLLCALNPDPGSMQGNSLLKGLPFVSSVLLKIFESIGTNWERVGNVRFAVTYKPQNDALDRAYAKDRAMQVAKEWSEAMQSGGAVKDFVAVGDVQIKVIGADNPIPDSDIPVRQMLEQIVAKTGLPPFMLGLSWSSTERMSSQQADTLTSELEAFRRVLTPVILKICGSFLRLAGYDGGAEVVWDDITLQDRTELSKAALYEAQAKALLAKIDEKG